MNPLDILMAIILGYCILMGFFRGLVREAISLLGVFIGFFIGYMTYTQLAGYLSKWVSEPSYLDIFSFFLIFCFFVIGAGLIGIIINYLWKPRVSVWINHLSGIGFGTLKGILIVSAVMIVLTAFLKPDTPLIQNSVFAPKVALVSEQMIKVSSMDLNKKFTAKLNQYKKSWISKF